MEQDDRNAELDVDLISAIGVGLYVLDASGSITTANPKAVGLLGWTAEQLVGRSAHDTIHASGHQHHDCPLLRVAVDGVATENDADVFRRADGSLIPVWWVATPLAPIDDGPAATVLVFGDTTDRQVQEVADEAEQAQVRSDLADAHDSISELGWLAEVNQALASAGDEGDALRRLARMCVPRLADVALIDRVASDGSMKRVGWTALDPSGIDVSALLERRDVQLVDGGGEATRSFVRGGVTVLDRAQYQEPGALDPSSRRLLDLMRAESVMLIPLQTRNNVLGVACLVRQAGRPGYSAHDEVVAAELARRAGLALDNLRQLNTEQNAAALLQTTLLPELSGNLKVDIAARYLPAQDLLKVGGDWYDAFACLDNDDRTVLVIGDVAGHDLGAVASMATLRNLIRGVVISAELDLAGCVDVVDKNLSRLNVHTTASAILMAVEPLDDPTPEAAWSVEWCNAGHLPPLLISSDGTAELLQPRYDAILGASAATPRQVNRTTVAAGSSVVLYTDGLVELRTEALERGLQRLVTAARGIAAPDAATLAAELLERLPRSPNDDTAFIVARLD